MECCNGGDLFDLIASHASQGGLAEHCAARVQAGGTPMDTQWVLYQIRVALHPSPGASFICLELFAPPAGSTPRREV